MRGRSSAKAAPKIQKGSSWAIRNLEKHSCSFVWQICWLHAFEAWYIFLVCFVRVWVGTRRRSGSKGWGSGALRQPEGTSQGQEWRVNSVRNGHCRWRKYLSPMHKRVHPIDMQAKCVFHPVELCSAKQDCLTLHNIEQRFQRFALLLIIHAFSCQMPRRRSSKKAGWEVVVDACCIILECDCCSIQKLFYGAMMQCYTSCVVPGLQATCIARGCALIETARLGFSIVDQESRRHVGKDFTC